MINNETEDNYNQILELLKEEDQQDKSKLIELIEELHNRYQSIYVRYDQITGKLKEKVYSKKEKDSSSSSSSDSDSDDSSKKNGSKNGKLKNKTQTVTDTEVEGLKRRLAVETEEKEALISQVQETEKILNESKLQTDRLQEENARLLSEFEDVKGELLKMNEKLKTTENEVSNLNQKVETAELKNETLSVECSLLREKLTDKETELFKQMEMHESFKNEAERKTRGIEDELESIRFHKTEIEKQKEDEILALQKKLEEEKTESQSQIDLLTEKIYSLQVELESMSTQKQESDNQVKKLGLEISDYLIKIESLMEEVANKNRDQEKLLEENKTSESKIKVLESKLKETLESKDQIVDQLEETIEDLRSDLEIKGDELNTLTEMIRNLEVKIRLANQKLRVTEQVLNGTENEHATKEEKLHQENKSLIEKNATLTQTIATIKREVQEKVNEILSGTDSLIVKFEEDYGHVTTRVYEITNEVQAARVQFKNMKEDMTQKFEEDYGHVTTRVYEITNEVQAARVQFKNMKEDMTQKVEEMTMKLEVYAGENERLMKSLEDLKTEIAKKVEKIIELENTIRLKDKGILDLGEDKREAIKQLCIWADYQRDRHDHLQEILLKTTTGTHVCKRKDNLVLHSYFPSNFENVPIWIALWEHTPYLEFDIKFNSGGMTPVLVPQCAVTFCSVIVVAYNILHVLYFAYVLKEKQDSGCLDVDFVIILSLKSYNTTATMYCIKVVKGVIANCKHALSFILLVVWVRVLHIKKILTVIREHNHLRVVPVMGDEEYRQTICVDGAAVEKPITLKRGEEWTGRLELNEKKKDTGSRSFISEP
nr:COP1-interactive protein 1 [Tanacetum cinerariifolium]